MARLIPRKQIEEQQDISSSLNVRQDVNIGNNAIISGSLFVSKSFFLGNEVNDKNEITGSVFLTGSLTIDGDLKVGAPDTILSFTSSFASESLNTQRYSGILAKDFGANVPTLYVSSTDGDDNNDGRTIQYPLRTIKRAAALAQPGYDGRYGFDTGSIQNGYVIKVQAGTYLEDNPVILPKNTTIWGAGLRITKINAKNPEQDLFYVNSGCYIAEVTMGGLRLWPDQINPVRGFAVAFQPGAFITTSPYVQNCSQISNQENSFTELYEEIPPGGGGLYVNGDVIDPDSPLASMVLDAYTQISPNGVGCLVNGRGFIQLVSFFNNFSYYAIRVNNGGHATLNNSNISFGLYGMYASGSRFISGSGGNIEARDRVRAGWSVVVDVLNRGIDALPDVTTLNTAEGIRVNSLITQSFFASPTQTASAANIEEIVSDFNLISAIVDSGTSNFPTLLARSSNKGYGFDSPYNILGAEQITASISASAQDVAQISSSFGVTLGIFADGTGSYTFESNTKNLVKATNLNTVSPTISATNFITSSISSSFSSIITILKNGLSATPALISNLSASVIATDTPFSSSGVSSSLSTVNSVSASLSIVYNILANGTGSNTLPIPNNHQRNFSVTNSGSVAYTFTGLGNNPTLTLFRGETYKFSISASQAIGGIDFPFWIRTQQVDGIDTIFDYNKGVINNGDSVGNITFKVPYDAPNTLYYVARTNKNLGGKINIVNNSATPIELIKSTLTYPPTIQSGSIPSDETDKINAYDLLLNNKTFIQDETITYLSSSWSDFSYNETTCRRDIGFIIDGVAKDLLYGGNEESIRSGLFYYQYPSEATTTQLAPTLTAIKYFSRLIQKILKNETFVQPNIDRESAWECILNNREFVQNEVISYISSSWSTFEYNEAKCKRDVGYILDAVATDVKYEGNERSIEAGRFYYLYPSEATGSQLIQTIDGIKYAAGIVNNLITNQTFVTASQTTQAAYSLIRNNKALVQDETIQFINVAFPTLEYNQSKCRRDVGFILDGVATDLLYGGNERSVASGRFYYDFPSVATSTQKKETAGGIRYAKIITEYIVQNIILDTPRIIFNDERNIKISALSNVTSSLSGSVSEQISISSSFNIVEGIIKKGINSINAIVAKNTNSNWSLNNPLKVSSNTQVTNSYVTPSEINTIGANFDIVTSIIQNGTGSLPTLTASIAGLYKVTGIEQIAGTAATNIETGSISSSFAHIINIIKNGTGSLQPFTSSVQNNIKATATSYSALVGGTSSHSGSVSSSMKVITDVLTNGLSSLPSLVLNSITGSLIKVSDVAQVTTSSLDNNLSASLFVSRSIAVVVDILRTGNVDVAKTPYVTQSLVSDKQSLASSHIVSNLEFIKAETIAYLSSSWSAFDYDEEKCKRDVGLIISGAAQDLYWGNISASAVNGQYYFEYPSQATGSQLQQTIDGIIYASNIAQKVIQGVTYQQLTGSLASASLALKNNKGFIIDETIAYMSSSWGSFDYNEVTCRRDLNYIIDSVRTDLVYGGNQRTRLSAEYYFLYPSDATGSQLIQTTDAINYASRIAQKVIVGQSFTQADTNDLNASNLLSKNRNLIANEVVAYVSSSWSNVFYNEDKCKRDVGYLIDAVRTDLVYGGNERSNIAGLFYYLYPSSATVAGVPSPTAQLDMTVTGMKYASSLSQRIALNQTLQTPSAAVFAAANLVRADIPFIQQNVIDYTNDTYPSLKYNQAKCFRDVRFITDAVITDLVYGGNERTIEAGTFYYLYPSQATDDQLDETIDAINFGRDLTKLIAIGGLEVERSFDVVAKIIASGSGVTPTIIKNTDFGIKASNINQITSSNLVSNVDKTNVSASFANVINIIANGTGSIPTIISSSFNGVLVGTGSQITSSNTPSITEINKVGNSFNIVTNIIANGTGSIPTIVTNATSSIKRTDTIQFRTTSSISQSDINLVKSSFDIILDIVENGTGSIPSLEKNTKDLIKITNVSQSIATSSLARSIRNSITSSFDTITNILANGTGSLPSVILNTNGLIKKTNEIQFVSASNATSTQVLAISASIGIVANIVYNGTGSIPNVIPYTSSLSSSAILSAYNLLKNNIGFIQSETIAYLSSSWSSASYDEEKCRRDIGFILSGSAEDLLWGSNSASIVNGKYYYEFPSLAQTAQLEQTLDGINYASRLAQKVILGSVFVTQSAEIHNAYNLIRNNRQFIQSESIQYISSSWSTHLYDETVCKRDLGYIIDAVTTDIYYGGNERTVKSGIYYYLYPSEATGSQLDETITGIKYAKELVDKILKGNIFTKVSNNKLQAKELLFKNKTFIANEAVAYVSASWNGFLYNEETCKRDVGYIIDAVITDFIYGGNERSIEAGRFYYDYPSEATTTQLGPTLSGISHAKGVSENILKNLLFVTASNSAKTAYTLLAENKALIQDETIRFVSSSWSMFNYNEASCSRDTGYIIDAVATDILYGGNQASARAGEYYYLYPSLATVDGDGDSAGQLGQTLDGIKYAKGLAQKIVSNIVLQTPSTSSLAGWNLLRQNKPLIQAETIAFLSSSWTGVDGFYYNQASCSRDVAYIIDNVATDLLYGGNERSSKAGEYYYLYPSKAIVAGVPSVNAQLEQTIDGVAFAAGVANKIISNTILEQPTLFVSSSVELLRKNRQFIQNETIQYIDSFYPDLVYNREKCRRDVGYIVDNVATDLWYGGNERAITAGQYYYLYPSLATKTEQVRETVAGVNYAKNVARKVVQNILLSSPALLSNTYSNIKVGNVNQYISLITPTQTEIDLISSSFSTVTKIIEGGLEVAPTKITNANSAIKVTNESQIKLLNSASITEVGIVTASFGLIRDIIYEGSASLPDALAENYQYGFEKNIPTLLHISSYNQIAGGSNAYTSYTSSISASFANTIKIINNGTSSIPTIIENTSASIKAQSIQSQILPNSDGGKYQRDRIGNLYNIVLNIIDNESYPNLIPNTSASVKVTNTPQFLSGSGADRIQAKLVSSSFGIVTSILINGTGSVQYVAPNITPNINPKINLAYNLLLNNKQMIVDETISFMSSSWSTFVYNQASCSRDLGFIIDGAAYDLLYGGNSASIVNGNFYYDFPSAATGSQLDQTVTAIKFASGLAEKVVRNITLQHISSSVETSASYETLRANKSFIQAEAITYLSSSWSEFDYNETTCKRDIGYIIDAVSTDLLYGGNERSYVAGRYYYDFPSQATDSQLQPTLDGIGYAKGLSMRVISGSSLSIPTSDTTNIYNLLKNNKKFIQEETVAFVNAKYPELYYDEAKCRRDVGFIIDAVITDFKWGGNQRSSKAGEFYYLYPSLATESEQVIETTAAIDYARRICEQIIIGTTISSPEVILNTANNIKVSSENQYISASSATAYEINRVSSSFSVVTNVVENGLGVLPTLISNVSESIKVTSVSQIAGTAATVNEANIISSSIVTITDIISNGTGSLPTEISNTSASIKVTNVPQILSGSYGTATEATYISQSIGIVVDIVSNGTGSLPASIPYTTPSTDPNVIHAYNLLKSNIPFIQAETIAYLSSSWSMFGYNEASCSRDVGFIVSGAAEDLYWNSNSASIVNGKFYYDFPSLAIVEGDGNESGQKDQTLDGIRYASELAQKVLQSIEFVTASTDVLNAQNLLVQNKPLIQAETIAYISSSWSMFNYNDISCSRDVAYIIDAATTDLVYGGNQRSIKAGYYYWKYPSLAIVEGDGNESGQKGQTLDGVNYTSRIAQQIVLGKTLGVPSTERKIASELLKLNKSFIAAETIAYISSSWVTGSNSDNAFVYNQLSCSRDVNYILDNVATDILYGGNERTIKAASYYFLYPSQATGSQLDETLDGIRFAGQMAQKVIVNTQFITASIHASASYALMKTNKPFIQAETIAYVSSSWVGFNYNEAKCRRDVGLLVDAVATDILYGGNERSAKAGIYYFKYPSSATGSQLEPTVNAIDFAGGAAKNIIQNITFVTASQSVSASVNLIRNNREFIQEETMQYLTASWSTFDYDKVKCRRDVGYILDGVATDILYGGNERSVMSGEFYFKYPSKATLLGDGDGEGQLKQTVEGINYASRVAQKIAQNIVFQTASIEASASFDLLRKNKSFIAAETIEYVSSSWSGVYYNQASCSRDVGYIIDAAATDLLYGGTERSIIAGTFYYLFPSRATNAGVPSEANQLDPTVTGVRYAGRLSKKVILNPVFNSPSQSVLYGRELLQKNKSFIQKETITFLSSSWSTLQYNEVSCSRDLGFILDAICTDLVYGGNERSIEAGSYYYKIPSVAIKESYTDNGTVGQKKQTVDGINYAKGVSEKVAAQFALTPPPTKRREAYQRLLAAKEELKQRAIGYTNGAFPYLVYNEASCSRDTGLIVDAVATDLLYGGNERSIAAASSYYNGQYGSAAAVINQQKLETLETNRYLRTRAEFIAAGAPLESFGSLIVATGIDYSYNGSGVTFKALPPNQGGSGVANPIYEITELAGGRIYFTSGNQDGDFRIGTGLSINQATGTLVGRTFSKSLFSLVTPFSLALEA